MSVHLRAERIHVRHPRADRDAVRDVSLAVNRGEVVALVGPNGSGKSTTLAALGRSLRPRTGHVLLGDRDVWSLPRREFALAVARLPQDPQCPEGLNVQQLVASGRHAHRSFFGSWSTDDRRALREAVRMMDLADLEHRPVETLSGGERRRAFIAMVLAQRSTTLLLDEPTAALDVRHQWEVIETLRRINREAGVTIVVVLHDLEQAAALAHRIAVMHRGRVYEVGEPQRCLHAEMLQDVFAVEAQVEKQDGRIRVGVLRPCDPLRAL